MTRSLRSLAIVLGAIMAPALAFAQSTVLQGGAWVPGHVPQYVGQGSQQPVIMDGGGAAGGGTGANISELGIVARSPTNTYPSAGQGTGPFGANLCDYDAPLTNATGYHFLCFSANAQGGGLLAYGAGGTAAQLPLNLNINGVAYQFPFSIGGVVGPSSSVLNNFSCWNNTAGTLLKDCGLSSTGTNAWAGLQNFNGGATAPTQINTDNSTNVATTAFVRAGTSNFPFPSGAPTTNQIPVATGSTTTAWQSATTWFDNAYCNTVGYIIVRFTGTWTCAQGIPVDIRWFGAVTGGTDQTAAINNAIAAAPSGGVVLIPQAGYSIANTVNITKPLTLLCGPTDQNVLASLTASTTTVDAVHINSNNVTVRDCTVSRAGTPVSGQGIVIGSDGNVLSDAICTNGSGVVTSASNGFAAAVVGMRVNLTSCGAGGIPLFATITVKTSNGNINVSPSAGNTPGAGVTGKYGNVYTDVLLENVISYNHFIAIHFINAARFHGDNVFALVPALNTGAMACQFEDQLAVDFGDSFWANSTCSATGTTSDYAIQYNSGGGLKLDNDKILGGKYGLFVNWNIGTSGGPYVSNTSIENCGTSGVFVTQAAQLNFLIFTGNEINCGAPNLQVDNSAAAALVAATITGNLFAGGGGTCIDLGKVNYATVTGNTCQTGGGNPSINVRSNATSPLLAANNIIGATLTYASASTTAVIDDPVGMSFSNLPTSVADGSRVMVTSGTVGAGKGRCDRINTAWSCFGLQGAWTPVLSGTTGGGVPTLATAVGSFEQNGRNITARATIVSTAQNAPTGNLQITGLPVTATATANDNGVCSVSQMSGVTLDTNYVILTGIIAPSASAISLFELGSGQAGQAVPVAKFANASTVELVCNYHN